MKYSFDIVDCIIRMKAKENDSSGDSAHGERNLDVECVLIDEVLRPVINDPMVRLNRTLHFVFDMALRIFHWPWYVSLVLRALLNQFLVANTFKSQADRRG